MSTLLRIIQFRLPLWLVSALMLIMLLGGMSGGIWLGIWLNRPQADSSCPESADVCADFAVFWDVWQLARERYVDPTAADPNRMLEGAVDGMLATLGDEGHTRFLTAAEAAQWQESLSGEFEGIGIYVGERNGELLILALIENSPAAAAGLRAGDRILAVDGASITGWTIDELVARVRGPAGTQVTLEVSRRDAGLLRFTITRARVTAPSVSWALLPDQIALIRITSFDEQAASGLRKALTAANDAGARAVILDLRNNPGGLLSALITIAGEFLPANTPILIERNRDGSQRVTTTRIAGIAQDIPMVVLINGGSASAAEILAGALQDAGRAVLIGETTVGTGTVLTPFRLNGGAQLLLGTQEWRTPAGRQIRGKGIEPDRVVPQPIDAPILLPAEARNLSAAELAASGDEQLLAAIATLQQ
ncbi:S41 family peptidase [Chloroflexus sp.]|uniref:S41 family peptidase n=1 Tax=Chloroflexus sp. TaxID=1904827 RepID=UPI0026114016|nr:S41 family peptidase [uncultured Chloroflexus sp.]